MRRAPRGTRSRGARNWPPRRRASGQTFARASASTLSSQSHSQSSTLRATSVPDSNESAGATRKRARVRVGSSSRRRICYSVAECRPLRLALATAANDFASCLCGTRTNTNLHKASRPQTRGALGATAPAGLNKQTERATLAGVSIGGLT